MKSQLLMIVLLGLSLGTSGSWNGAADIFGTWVFSVDTGKFSRNLTFVFKQHNESYVGANALVMRLEPTGSDKKTLQLAARYDDLLRRVEAISGVKSASLVEYSPKSLREWIVRGDTPEDLDWPISVEGDVPQPGENMRVPSMQVYPNSFAAFGVNLLAGRDFSQQDNQKWLWEALCRVDACPRRVGIINESMERRFFANKNPIGQRFGFDAGCPPETICRHEVIGVVKDVKDVGAPYEGREMFYLPFPNPANPVVGR